MPIHVDDGSDDRADQDGARQVTDQTIAELDCLVGNPQQTQSDDREKCTQRYADRDVDAVLVALLLFEHSVIMGFIANARARTRGHRRNTPRL